MKKLLYLIFITVLVSACTGRNGFDYALGKGCYFTKPNSDYIAIYGKTSDIINTEGLGYDTINKLLYVTACELNIDKINFYLLSFNKYKPTPIPSIIGDSDYLIHALVDKRGIKNGFLQRECNYTDSYYFVDEQELNEAIEVYNSTSKAKKLDSKFKSTDDEDGYKTIHSKVIALVKYKGYIGRSSSEFKSLYLESGDIIQYFDDERIYKGDFIDCIVDKNYTVIDNNYEIH